MGTRSVNSVSDEGTVMTDLSSFPYSDDTQSSTDLEDAVIDFNRNVSSTSVKWKPMPQRSEIYSSFLPSSSAKSAPSVATFRDDELVAIEEDGEESAEPTKSDVFMEEGQESGLIPRIKRFIRRPPPLVWVAVLLIFILVFVCCVLFWPVSTDPPGLPLIQNPVSYTLPNYSHPTIHANRTTREMFLTNHKMHDELFSSDRYSQSLDYLGNTSFPLNSFSQSRTCSEIVDKNVLCCRVLDAPLCYFREGETIRNFSLRQESVLDVEYVDGRMHVLKRNLLRHALSIDDGLQERAVKVMSVPHEYNFKLAFLQNGTVFSAYAHRENCGLMICQDAECQSVRDPMCGFERMFAALPANSLVLLFCDPDSVRKQHGLYTQLTCTLTQLLLPSMTVIAKSAPFKYTKSPRTDQLIYGFADYMHTSVFHVNLLRLATQTPIVSDDATWEVVVFSFRLHS